ncbi:short-chain dehydrogenase [Leucobacter sp. UCD-THU]|uniref:SDR family NAD(P)-dependent oxidoreductase n=1 Tax=Leucobacter sp. UCD-THU TaxID=1292023 RepID=UPI00037460D7|nr:SDR family NAD(P)-dependent oxidoreductase [Leucobacter sp. UCD-THU]EYT56269.1 short-chain dehydrogenase [Leucobacter sp. UCD-THU]
MTRHTTRSALIVGATSVIAQHIARRWADGGATRFVLVGRSEERLERVAADLRVRGGSPEVAVVALDLLDPAAIERAVADAADHTDPDTVLIAHGAMHEQQRMQRDLALAKDQLEATGVSPSLWLDAAVGLTRATRIAVIGSVAGDRGRASNFLYGSAKGMVERVAEGEQHRLHGSGRRVTLVKPGPTATPMTAPLQESGARLASAAAVAGIVARGIAAGRPVVYAPGLWRWIMLAVRLAPRWLFERTSL